MVLVQVCSRGRIHDYNLQTIDASQGKDGACEVFSVVVGCWLCFNAGEQRLSWPLILRSSPFQHHFFSREQLDLLMRHQQLVVLYVSDIIFYR